MPIVQSSRPTNCRGKSNEIKRYDKSTMIWNIRKNRRNSLDQLPKYRTGIYIICEKKSCKKCTQGGKLCNTINNWRANSEARVPWS